jgi:hypothetical protein
MKNSSPLEKKCTVSSAEKRQRQEEEARGGLHGLADYMD